MSAGSKNLVLVAMIFAVAMMFIDQTIVALAVPELQRELGLSATGTQWIINGYLLALSALFAFGGKLGDVLGHRRMVLTGVVGFAVTSALCGATPTGSLAEPWLIFFRVLQGASAAVMFPAALAIVVASFPLRERGRALALFFAITGGLTAVGPIAGGFLTEWTWRAIFWVNVPVAIIAVVLTAMAKPAENKHPARLDLRGAVMVSGAMGLIVLALQQSTQWGWGSLATWGCIVAGLALLAAFVVHELRSAEPLIQLRIFADRAFTVDNVVLFLLSVTFVPLFFFASLYSQVSLGNDASNAGLYLMIWFAGFAAASQLGGRILDTRGARPAVVAGCLIAAIGFALWGSSLPDLSVDSQWIYIVIAGAGLGLVLGPVSTDAANRAPRSRYGEVMGITQTTRNFGSSLGIAVLGSVLIARNTANVESTLESAGVPAAAAERVAHAVTSSGGGETGSFAAEAGGRAGELFRSVQLAFAHSVETVFYLMAGVMVVAFVIALIGVPHGRVEETVAEEPEDSAVGPVPGAPA